MEKSVLKLAQMAHSESILEAAIGMAAINSLLEIDVERCLDLNARCEFSDYINARFLIILSDNRILQIILSSEGRRGRPARFQS
jgi:uncharacterized protein (DUF4213/DUF364 family)